VLIKINTPFSDSPQMFSISLRVIVYVPDIDTREKRPTAYGRIRQGIVLAPNHRLAAH